MVHFHSYLSSTSQQQLGKLWGGEGWEWSNPEGQNVKLYRKIVAEKNYANIYHIFKVYKNCAELYKAGKQKSGVYSIDPDNTGTFDVYCDQKTDGGGGQCSKRDWTAQLISTAAGKTTNEALGI